MDLTVGLIFLAVFVFSWFMMRKRLNLPPGPMSLPLVGSLPFMRSIKNKAAYEAMLEASKEYGDIFSFKIGRQLFVVLNGYDVLHEALVKQAHVFSGRTNFLPGIKRALKTGRGILLEGYNHKWKMVRRFTLQTLRDFGVGKTSLEEKVNEEIKAISKILVASEGAPVDMNGLLQKAIGNVIYGIVFGHRYDFDDPEFLRIRKMIQRLFEGPGIFNPSNFYPQLLLRILRSKYSISAANQHINEMQSFIYEQIQGHESTYDENNIRDFVDLYIKWSKEDADSEKNGFTKGNMMRVIRDLFVAGSDTTSTALTWAFLFMSEYPEVQTKCQEEILEAIGDRVPSYSDRDKMMYVEATLREIQRHAKVLPLSVPHATTDDTTLCGYDIPKNTIVLTNIASATVDERFWSNPRKFDPGRFIDELGKLIRNEALIPFSIGPRTCLGEPLARMELFLIFTSLLQRFTFYREDENKPHSMKSRPTNVTNLPEPFNVRVKLRM